jgi:hypothetical protein
MIHFATDPNFYVPLQTGWHWLLTPVKGEVVVNGWNGPSFTPWYDLHLSTGIYMDLRVLFIDAVILVILIGVLPKWLSGAKYGRILSFLSVAAGLLFGLVLGLLSDISNPGLSFLIPLGIWFATLVACILAAHGAMRRRSATRSTS